MIIISVILNNDTTAHAKAGDRAMINRDGF